MSKLIYKNHTAHSTVDHWVPPLFSAKLLYCMPYVHANIKKLSRLKRNNSEKCNRFRV